MKSNTKQVVLASMFATLCCIGTLIIQFPVPATQGIIHAGDGFVILAGIFLGPVYGFLAAGFGSALANLIAGHVIWAPATLVIKGSLALLSAILFQQIKSKQKPAYIAIILAGITNMILVAGGYFLYGGLFVVGFLAATVGIPMDLLQGLIGFLLALVLYPIVNKIPDIRTSVSK